MLKPSWIESKDEKNWEGEIYRDRDSHVDIDIHTQISTYNYFLLVTMYHVLRISDHRELYPKFPERENNSKTLYPETTSYETF